MSSLSAGQSIVCPTRMSLYIFLLYNIYYLCFTCIYYYDLSAWDGCWFVVYMRKFIYNFLNVCPFDYTAVARRGKVGPVNQVNHTSWVAIVTPTDRPTSVRNRSVIELFCTVVCVVILPFWHFCWCRGFCHMTESDLFFFLLRSFDVTRSEQIIGTIYNNIFCKITSMCQILPIGAKANGNHARYWNVILHLTAYDTVSKIYVNF